MSVPFDVGAPSTYVGRSIRPRGASTQPVPTLMGLTSSSLPAWGYDSSGHDECTHEFSSGLRED